MKKLIVTCPEGFGDNLYNRLVLHSLILKYEIQIETVLPQLYKDFFDNYKSVRWVAPPKVIHRTQQDAFKDAIREGYVPTELDMTDAIVVKPLYGGGALLDGHSILSAIEKNYRDQGIQIDIPDYGALIKYPDYELTPKLLNFFKDNGYINSTKIAVIRPPTVRKEWPVPARGCNVKYLIDAVKMLNNAGWVTISIADTKEGESIPMGWTDTCTHHFDSGQFTFTEVLSLIDVSNLVVGSPGFIVPAGWMSGKPTFIIYGGRGAYDSPATHFDIRFPMVNIGWALPDNFCECHVDNHQCDKTITGFRAKFMEFYNRHI